MELYKWICYHNLAWPPSHINFLQLQSITWANEYMFIGPCVALSDEKYIKVYPRVDMINFIYCVCVYVCVCVCVCVYVCLCVALEHLINTD